MQVPGQSWSGCSPDDCLGNPTQTGDGEHAGLEEGPGARASAPPAADPSVIPAPQQGSLSGRYLDLAPHEGGDVVLVLEDGQGLQEVLLQPPPVLRDFLPGAACGRGETGAAAGQPPEPCSSAPGPRDTCPALGDTRRGVQPRGLAQGPGPVPGCPGRSLLSPGGRAGLLRGTDLVGNQVIVVKS